MELFETGNGLAMGDNVERTAVLESQIEQINSTMNKIAEKMEVIHELAQIITRVQEKQVRHDEGLDRAFSDLGSMRAEFQRYAKESGDKIGDLKTQLSYWKGALVIVAFVLAGAQTSVWRGYDNYSNTVSAITATEVNQDKRLSVIETIVGRALGSPYQSGDRP